MKKNMSNVLAMLLVLGAWAALPGCSLELLEEGKSDLNISLEEVIPPTSGSGEQGYVRFTVKNYEPNPTSGQIALMFFPDLDFPPSIKQGGGQEIWAGPGLGPNETRDYYETVNFNGLTGGTAYVTVDHYGYVDETNENNNVSNPIEWGSATANAVTDCQGTELSAYGTINGSVLANDTCSYTTNLSVLDQYYSFTLTNTLGSAYIYADNPSGTNVSSGTNGAYIESLTFQANPVGNYTIRVTGVASATNFTLTRSP